jgi:hypothetical protein
MHQLKGACEEIMLLHNYVDIFQFVFQVMDLAK